MKKKKKKWKLQARVQTTTEQGTPSLIPNMKQPYNTMQ